MSGGEDVERGMGRHDPEPIMLPPEIIFTLCAFREIAFIVKANKRWPRILNLLGRVFDIRLRNSK
jgi:hypothetical protein